MKRIKFIVLFALMSWVMFSCEKDEKEGLGYDVEGEWKMITYQENNNTGPFTDGLTYKITFSNYNGNQGSSQWWYYSESGVLASDTSYCNYRMYDQDQWLTLYWTEHGTIFTGGFDSIRYAINLSNDTLFLECQADDGGNYRRVVAVRE